LRCSDVKPLSLTHLGDIIEQIVYVPFDALLGYIGTATSEGMT